jgi:hypothetical protein
MTNIIMLIGPGRYRLTRQALETLGMYTPEPCTITLVCDGVDFRTGSVVGNFSSHFKDVSFLHVENSGHTLSQLKNLGVAWSEQRFGRGDWLYISDSDVAFTPGWLEKLTTFAEDTEEAGARLWGGQIHPFHQPIGELTESGIGIEGSRIWGTWHSVLDGPSWLMRWETWNSAGPFDRTTAPGVCQSEEYSVCERIGKNNGRIGVINPYVVWHTGLTHLDGHDCVGRKEREAMIPKGILAE